MDGMFFTLKMKEVESMTRQRKWFYGVFGVLFVLILLLYGFIIMFTYRGTPEAMEKWNEHSYVKKNQYYRFDAKGEEQATLLFYTGALVEPQAYVGIAQGLAQNGITTYVIESSLNLPIFEMGTMETIVKEEKLNKVYVAGHSLGGVVASLDAVTLQKENHLAGLILFASYPDKSVDFSSSDVPVLSIVASHDKILNWEKYEASKSRLPKSSEELMIEGGNHSGFGMYGEQKGDGKASISNKEQQQKVIEKLTEFMKKPK